MTTVIDKTGFNSNFQNIFRFWRTIEALTPQDASKKNPNDRLSPVYDVQTGAPMPWMCPHHSRLSLKPNHEWRYAVESVIYDANRLIELLRDKIGRDDNAFEERPTSKASRLFDLVVNHSGHPLADSFVLAMSGWSSGVILRWNLGKLEDGKACDVKGLPPVIYPSTDSGFTGFDRLQDSLREELVRRIVLLKNRDDQAPRPIDRAWLDDFSALVIKKCQLSELITEPISYRVRCYQVRIDQKQSDDADYQDDSLLNSFYIGDLSSLVRSGSEMGQGLQDFMHSPTSNNRIDVRSTDGLHRAWELLNPVNHPIGRWPSEYPLAFSQQVAVNAIWKKLKDTPGIFAVNGPPGTGKTTLLRDIVAAIVVERAKKLLAVQEPSMAIGSKRYVKIGERNIPYHPFNSDFLRGTSIIVASSNNGAVENISLELPRVQAISEQWAESVDYFQNVANVVIGEKAWGLLAARLGNKKNRSEFAQKFWWGVENKKDNTKSITVKSIIENKQNNHGEAILGWEDAVNRFKSALKIEAECRAKLIEASETPRKIETIDENLSDSQARLVVIKNNIKQITNSLAEATQAKETAELELNTAKKALDDCLHCKPGILEWLSTLGRSHKEWRTDIRDRQIKVDACRDQHLLAITHCKQVKKNQSILLEQQEKLEQSVCRLTEEKHLSISQLESLQSWVGQHWPDQECNAAQRELSAPWAIHEWNMARTEVFLAALSVHRSFIEANADSMLRNIGLAVDWLQGKPLPQDLCEFALNVFSFVVPVISTTFASIPRFLKNIGKESIGWLLIDEAGQAVPQAAAGAIWRAQRTVVVGDPMQLEPIVVIPSKVEAALGDCYHVDEWWWPSCTSVQVLADNATFFGTHLPGQDNDVPIWVGSPLRVHRRCLEPMFSISNQIAYDGLMVNGKTLDNDCPLPPSAWIDVQGISAEGHWVVEEGKAVNILMAQLCRDHRVSPQNIFMISPFRDVVRKLKESFKNCHVGTIHTTQGKEAEVVILVLGGNPNNQGAKDWAAKKPNLLNVAASRGKKRLYIIGNRIEWEKRRHFSLASKLMG